MQWDWTFPTDTPIEQRTEVVVYSNRFLTVYDDEVWFADDPDQVDPRYLRIEESKGRPGAAALATCGDLVALVLVYRYPLGTWEWGLPRGFAASDHVGITVFTELNEELGGIPRRSTPMGVVRANSGLLAGWTALFHAEYDTPVANPQDPEVREVRWLPVPDLMQAIAEGHVTDGFTMSALTAAAARGIVRLNAVTEGTEVTNDWVRRRR